MARIEEQLKATGLAQVIVVLKEPVRRRGKAATRPVAETATLSDLDAIRRSLEPHFSDSQFTRDGALATAIRFRMRHRQESAALRTPRARLFPNLGLMLGSVDKAGLQGLRKDRRVRAVKPAPHLSLIRPVEAAPAKPAGDVEWGLQRLEVPTVWDRGFTGKGVLVGHLDTGVDGDHPALKGAIAQFAEFDLLGEPVAAAKPHDSGEHGTHTAGTIAGRTVQSTSFGVAPEALLASAIVIEGGNVVARILAGMDWVVGLGARVLSMSLGVRGYQEDFLAVTRTLRARGVLPVFAVGNEGAGTSRSPGNYAEALSVGACDREDEVPSFSSSQRFMRPGNPLVPDLVAPGVDIVSCVPDGGYKTMSGSSMSAPHIAGLAALLFQAKPTASVEEVEAAIFGSCVLPPSMIAERANRGIPSAHRALEVLLGPTAAALETSAATGRARPRRRKSTTPKIDSTP
jgi:subtilisin family serine protease